MTLLALPAHRTLTDTTLLDLALDIFADVGFEGASVRELCRRLNVSHNLVHERFGSKDQLWQAAVAHGFQELAVTLASAAAQAPPDPLDRLPRCSSATSRPSPPGPRSSASSTTRPRTPARGSTTSTASTCVRRTTCPTRRCACSRRRVGPTASPRPRCTSSWATAPAAWPACPTWPDASAPPTPTP